ncbi:hypothetical protein BGW36DRAFT_167682 [Talaromyces proteolyticus]|uniref:ADP-ribosylation factor n=1 Tax=Talaromyces proteolyticus TaxID=1131652 RepID=A0AAD4Q092_9EURO|nr:uncharacterized protein BGW36DRAFT_167682 [Talaromyces proteolyticus]KAH8697412.1 hypothetical protein BGW36DRAFT_167682 [Talaromyces proteolyticus]
METTRQAPTTVQTAAGYYKSISVNDSNLAERFSDIDDAASFQEKQKLLVNPATRNFVLDFGNEDAWCAGDLDENEFTALINEPRPRFFGTRWIHLWAPEAQKESIKILAQQYGLSYRLIKMLCTDPVPKTKSPIAEEKAYENVPSGQQDDEKATSTAKPVGNDLENAYHLKTIDPATASTETLSMSGLTFSHIINHIWHFCSVDYGPRYTCIGYNSLYAVKIGDRAISNGKGLPDGKRLWSWIILCDDGTIISLQENPFPGPYKPNVQEEQAILGAARRNIISIFSGASKYHASRFDSESLVTVRVRHFSDTEQDEASIKQEDGPSLIVYYLFDDWVSSYGLVSRREHMYGAMLEGLRKDMLQKPMVDLVDDLHWLGRRLAILKRLYQSYELVVTRILQRQRLLRDESRTRRPGHRRNMSVFSDTDNLDAHHMSLSATSFLEAYDDTAGVQLSSAAVGRFERLADRIRLYCLSEIEACLAEKETLTFLNFNLIALKDSQAVEKLTRITILLAKATILFLPISLMTGYFSIQLPDVAGPLTARAYWISFAVLMVLSILLLAVFGYASDTVEGKTIYRSVTRSFFNSSRQRSRQLMTQKRER